MITNSWLVVVKWQDSSVISQGVFFNGQSVIAMKRAFRRHFDISPQGLGPDKKNVF
ncbi:hypothetical protein TNCV_1243201 [Trichonephila clavipes]|nr:hypothetical protein TNCV_1243201 [Trichonephila clavipes]